MRIGELSRRSGVSVPTIKYYVREGMLPEGERTAVNQVSYSEEHLRRLRLIRSLIDVGGLPVATVRKVLTEVDRPDPSIHRAIAAAHKELAVPTGQAAEQEREYARSVAEAMFAERNWTHTENNPGVTALVEVLAQLRLLGQHDLVDHVGRYAEAVESVVKIDIDFLATRATAAESVEAVVLGTVLGDVLITALRRIAQQELFNRHAEQEH